MTNELTTTQQKGITTVEGSKLVLSRQTSLDLAREAIRLKTPIWEINLESRVVSNGQMYVGELYDLSFDENGVLGGVYLKYYEAIPEPEKQEPAKKTLIERVFETIFGNAASTVRGDIRNNGKNYRKIWGVGICNETFFRNRLYWYNEYDRKLSPEFLKELKARAANYSNCLISNKLLDELFSPLHQAVIELYSELRRF